VPPLPKRKLSKARRGRRRANDALQPVHLVVCPQCKAMRLPHVVCPTCGTYRGETVIEMKADTKKKE
jgi:large subunit ribosomal protein L32